jgi:hypothetical protein
MISVETRIYRAQERWILKRFGKEAADSANYGWGVSATDDYVSVQTKVYGHGVLTSEASPSVRVAHEFFEDKR